MMQQPTSKLQVHCNVLDSGTHNWEVRKGSNLYFFISLLFIQKSQMRKLVEPKICLSSFQPFTDALAGELVSPLHIRLMCIRLNDLLRNMDLLFSVEIKISCDF